jgi:signal transduction histidine kinase
MASSSEETGAAPNLSALLKERRQVLIDLWSASVTRENTVDPLPHSELLDHIPHFVDELIAALYPEALPLPSATESSLEHGAQRLRLGFNVAEVVREYGTLHRSIIGIAVDGNLTITPHEHEVIARWLNAGIANAVSQYVNDRDAELHRQASEHLGFIAHEIRNPLSSARMAFRLLRARELVAGGRTVDLLDRTLRRTADVIDNTLNHASLSLGIEPRLEPLALRKVLEEIALDCGAEAQGKDIDIVVTATQELVVDADARLVHSAVSNLVQNALKFSHPRTTLQVRADSRDGFAAIEIEDACGGLPPGRAEDLFKPLVRGEQDQAGFGFGLAIAQQAARAHNGTLRVRDLPGRGCVFTLELPMR